MQISNLFAHEILDSKGDPTVEVLVELADGTIASGQVPSGASTGASEAVELRDGGERVRGKGVQKAVDSVNQQFKPLLVGQDATNQRMIDQHMIEADGTENKARLGGNAMVGVSMAVCRAAARSARLPLYQYIGQLNSNTTFAMPQPMILVMEGGKHGNWATDIQEFMIMPQREKFGGLREMLFAGAEVFHALGKLLVKKDYDAGVGFEGAYAPRQLQSNGEALELIMDGIQAAGFQPGVDFKLAIDAAASEFFQDGNYVLKSEQNKVVTPAEWSAQLGRWVQEFPFQSVEDPFHQEQWQSWSDFVAAHGHNIQVVGDDLVTTNVTRIQKAIDSKAMNATLIKVNQIGTVSETLDAINLTHQVGFTSIVSHRGGETNDAFIADLVVGTHSAQSKFGGPDRGERLAKYNRLLGIENVLSGVPAAILEW